MTERAGGLLYERNHPRFCQNYGLPLKSAPYPHLNIKFLFTSLHLGTHFLFITSILSVRVIVMVLILGFCWQKPLGLSDDDLHYIL